MAVEDYITLSEDAIDDDNKLMDAAKQVRIFEIWM